MVCDIFFYSHPERIPKVSGVCPRFVQDMSKTFLENSLNHSFWIPFDSFSFLAGTFFKKKSPKLLRISILLHNFAIATIIVRSTPHRQRARIYVQARPTFLIGYGLIFLPVTCRICTGYALCLCGALRIMWRCYLKIYGGSPSTCFYCPLWRKALLL